MACLSGKGHGKNHASNVHEWKISWFSQKIDDLLDSLVWADRGPAVLGKCIIFVIVIIYIYI